MLKHRIKLRVGGRAERLRFVNYNYLTAIPHKAFMHKIEGVFEKSGWNDV
jgi:hypothetical protein